MGYTTVHFGNMPLYGLIHILHIYLQSNIAHVINHSLASVSCPG